ncbi:hypothetical protein F5B20DRAFT_555634 [Whalleya microplaca]|nr:hypothetical protein F5B20DRAFT_555634 [Whalleya microplaca]
MAHAWLDSLSEDWVSQPRSENSQIQLPSLTSSTRPDPSHDNKPSRGPVSRIPRVCDAARAASRRSQQLAHDSSAQILSERSSNDINIRGLQRDPSKFSPLLKKSQRGRYFSRSASASTSASVVHDTVQHKVSQSASPTKTKENIPEWKRRLVYGELNYGESKDLFSSAGTGLENMFRPPVEADSPADETLEENGGYAPNETTLPSSPPPYLRHAQPEAQADETEDQFMDESSIRHAAPQPRPVVFRRIEDDTEDFSPEGNSTFEERHDSQDVGTNEPSNNSISSLQANQHLDASRKTSGQSDRRNEDLSPILISRHNSGDGKVSFTPVELPAQQLRKRLEKLRRNQMLIDAEFDSDQDQEPATARSGSQKFDTTDDYVKNGGFLNLQRGGRSAEDSFRRRPLSPPLHIDTSEMLPESSLQASTPKQFPTVRVERYASADRNNDPQSPKSPVLPRAPHPSPEKRLQPPSGHNGSPLKLFGPYDTFTNQTLLRRISQFEDQMTEGPSRAAQDESIAFSAQEAPSHSEYIQGRGPESHLSKARQVSHDYQETIDAVNTFGSGELDGYEFSEDLTMNSVDRSHYTDKENVAPRDRLTVPSQAVKFDLHRAFPAEDESLFIQRRRHKSNTSISSRHALPVSMTFSSSRPQSSSHPTAPIHYIVQATPKRDSLESKRPRSSPSKDPTPKRRRTLHRSDIAYGLEDGRVTIESVQSSHRTMQSAIVRERIDNHHNNFQQIADPRTLASRQILRPRSPTPSQKSSVTRDRQPPMSLDFDRSKASARARESDISVQDFAADGSRKTSMKTQDFFDAAEEIMAMIRSKARLNNDLGSVEESRVESAERCSPNETGGYEESFQESTKEPFSRPPSREGAPIIRMPVRQEDPELADRLKMYEEELSELGGIISSSMHSLGRARKIAHEANHLNEAAQQSSRFEETQPSALDEQEVISDLPNVRISRNPDKPELVDNGAEFPSNRSRSSGNSTGRSIPTNSSRGSDSKRLIRPDVVSQLISDQVGNMMFDKDRNVWHKVKPARPTSRGGNILPSEDSEDPFASIPDLSVDTVKETRNLGLGVPENLGRPGTASSEDAPSQSTLKRRSPTTQGSTRTRSATSHTKETLRRMKQTLVETAVEDDEEIEHEITIHEDRLQRSSPLRRKNLTITFSSPIASVIQDVAHQSDSGKGDEESGVVDESVCNIASGSQKRGRDAKSGGSANASTTKSRSRSRSRGQPKNLSVKGEAFIPRPVSRIDEQDEDTAGEPGEPSKPDASEQCQVSNREDSTIVCPDAEDKRNTSVSVIITTPAPTKTIPHSGTPVIGQYVGTLSLSPMSEFTMHQIDQPCGLEVSYVVGEQYLATGDGSKKILSKAVRHLVEKITEVEPFDPDWDTLDELDISNKNLTTLHRLDEFCGSVVTLNAADNAIEHLDGVPRCVRNLKMTSNQLSELTAWGHLMNLQYVDISNNQINSLHAFKDLVHLRTLRADNNQITSLDGIKLHDSLQVLRVRGNLIEDVNLDGTRMGRLTELDLEGNQITSLQCLEQLPCLSLLNLQHNRLSSFAPSPDFIIPNIQYLKLARNDLTSLDLSPFPSLRLLLADQNQLTAVTGFAACRRLDTLSLRSQQHDAPLDAGALLSAAYEVRKVFLSGNALGRSLDRLRLDLLNLQYLELANCGLRTLPRGLGLLLPNLRALNLNFNALEELEPLRFIPRLKYLYLAGNRIANAARAVDVLGGFPHLARLDLRDNLTTHGFYAPVQQPMPSASTSDEGDGKGRGKGEGKWVTGSGDGAGFFMLPDADPERDWQFARRADLRTRMRRRLHERFVLEACRRLRVLDGLPTAGIEVERRDAVYDALVASGIYMKEKPAGENVEEAEEEDGGQGEEMDEGKGEEIGGEKGGENGEENGENKEEAAAKKEAEIPR